MNPPFTPIFLNWRRVPSYERAERIAEEVYVHEVLVNKIKDVLKVAKSNKLEDLQVEIDSIDWTLEDVLESLIFNLEEDLKTLKSTL